MTIPTKGQIKPIYHMSPLICSSRKGKVIHDERSHNNSYLWDLWGGINPTNGIDGEGA